MKILGFLFLAAPLTSMAFVLSMAREGARPERSYSSIASSSGNGLSALERGNRVIAELEGEIAGGRRKLTVKEHPAEDGFVTLQIEGSGERIVASRLLLAIDRDESDVRSYGITMSAGSSGFLVQTGKDWKGAGGASWWSDYRIERMEGRYLLSRFQYRFHGTDGTRTDCTLNPIEGAARINGRDVKIARLETDAASASGLELVRACQGLAAGI